MRKHNKQTKKELMKRQLEILGQAEDFEEIVKKEMFEDALIDDSFANVLRLILFGQGSAVEEELMVILTYTKEKLYRLVTQGK